MQKKPLKHIADLRAGHTFKTRIDYDPLGEIPVLQIRDITDSSRLSTEHLPRIRLADHKVGPNVQAGDVVLPVRGEQYRAAALIGPEAAIASSHLFILHPKTPHLLADYLSWYLNQSSAQNYFLSHRTGTSIPMLRKSALGELQVPVPALDIQQKIVKLQQGFEREQQLTRQLLDNREKMLKGIFQQLLEQQAE